MSDAPPLSPTSGWSAIRSCRAYSTDYESTSRTGHLGNQCLPPAPSTHTQRHLFFSASVPQAAVPLNLSPCMLPTQQLQLVIGMRAHSVSPRPPAAGQPPCGSTYPSSLRWPSSRPPACLCTSAQALPPRLAACRRRSERGGQLVLGRLARAWQAWAGSCRRSAQRAWHTLCLHCHSALPALHSAVPYLNGFQQHDKHNASHPALPPHPGATPCPPRPAPTAPAPAWRSAWCCCWTTCQSHPPGGSPPHVRGDAMRSGQRLAVQHMRCGAAAQLCFVGAPSCTELA